MATASTHRTTSAAALPGRSEALSRWFRLWLRGYFRKHFHAVRLARTGWTGVAPDWPLLIVANHPSWWDPLMGLLLSGLFPEHAHFAAMDAQALARHSFFKKLGFYGVEQGTRRGAAAFLHTTMAILACPGSAVWITAQGRFTDPRVRPTLLRRGVGHVARRLNRGLILPMALEYPFWEERLPEALCRFGTPIAIENGRRLTVTQWVERIEAGLMATQDALREIALGRDPAAFETLVAGNAAIGGVYDCGRRLRAWLSGTRFQAEHGSEEGNRDPGGTGNGGVGSGGHSGVGLLEEPGRLPTAAGTCGPGRQ